MEKDKEKDKENYRDMDQIIDYMNILYLKRIRLCGARECIIEDLSLADSWKYARKKIVLVVEDYLFPYFCELAVQQLQKQFGEKG